MTHQEKAKELVEKFTFEKPAKRQELGFFVSRQTAKQCALICVDEMKKVESQILEGVPADCVYTYEPDLDEVKNEINKL